MRDRDLPYNLGIYFFLAAAFDFVLAGAFAFAFFLSLP